MGEMMMMVGGDCYVGITGRIWDRSSSSEGNPQIGGSATTPQSTKPTLIIATLSL